MLTIRSRFAYDAIGEIFLSRKLGYLEKGCDYNGFITTLETAVPAIQASGHLPLYLRPFSLLLAAILPDVRAAKRGVDQMGIDCKKYVQERYELMKEGKPVRDDFLSRLVQVHLDRGEELDLQLVDIQVEIYIPM